MDRNGARRLSATTGGTGIAASIRRDVAHRLRLLAAVVHNLLVTAIARTVVAGLTAAVVSVVSVTAAASGLSIGGAENQSERRSKHT